jgi:toxin ParE1/3/4
MPRYRLSGPAKVDLAAILRRSEQLHGKEARLRYRALLTAALRRVAAEPKGPLSTDRSDLLAGVRSFHIRHSRTDSSEARVAGPVHVIFYRALRPGLVGDRSRPTRAHGPAPASRWRPLDRFPVELGRNASTCAVSVAANSRSFASSRRRSAAKRTSGKRPGPMHLKASLSLRLSCRGSRGAVARFVPVRTCMGPGLVPLGAFQALAAPGRWWAWSCDGRSMRLSTRKSS